MSGLCQAKNFEKVATCYYRMEDYDALERLVAMVPYGNREFLTELGHMLQTVGMVEAAAECFIKVSQRLSPWSLDTGKISYDGLLVARGGRLASLPPE
jgi:pentatricopeptide repeat protein